MSTATIDHVTPHQPQKAPQEQPEPYSPETFVLWSRMDDGSWFLAIIDPDPPGEDP